MKTETKIEKSIQNAVNDCLAGLDHLPSQEEEIFQKARERKIMQTAYPTLKARTAGRTQRNTAETGRPFPLRAALAAFTVLALLAGALAVTRRLNPVDNVSVTATQPLTLPEETPDSALAGNTGAGRETETVPLDRVELTVEPDLLWNEETGILAEGPDIDKTTRPYRNAVYQKWSKKTVEGKMAYISGATGETVTSCNIGLSIDDTDIFGMDLPQKGLRIHGEINAKLFDNRPYDSWFLISLSNAEQDGLLTRLADVVQSRLVEKYSGLRILTLDWKPVTVYLNGEYWGQYNMRELPDSETVCRFEGVNPDTVDGVYFAEGLNDGSITALSRELKKLDPVNNAADREYLEQNVDVDSFLNWLAIEMYFGNSDAVSSFTAYRIPGQPWKCVLNELEYGLFLSSFNASESFLKEEGFGAQKADNTIFRKILEIDEYRHVFLRKLGQLYQKLTTEVMQAELELCTAMIEPEMERHFERWALYHETVLNPEIPKSVKKAMEYWRKRIERMRDGTMKKRPWYVYTQAQEFFSLSNAEMKQYFGE